mmetsp:Transcript_15832/g.43181  ORF Transcript_15832/g.43181 Transcript_15832/m.43181 type:complete len:202 (+) Transcript_15832:347-952(+)
MINFEGVAVTPTDINFPISSSRATWSRDALGRRDSSPPSHREGRHVQDTDFDGSDLTAQTWTRPSRQNSTGTSRRPQHTGAPSELGQCGLGIHAGQILILDTNELPTSCDTQRLRVAASGNLCNCERLCSRMKPHSHRLSRERHHQPSSRIGLEVHPKSQCPKLGELSHFRAFLSLLSWMRDCFRESALGNLVLDGDLIRG